MPHDHFSPSGHPYKEDQDTSLSQSQITEIAIRELLIEKGHITAQEIQDQVEAMDKRSAADGAKLVARAWSDPAFDKRLQENASDAAREMGFNIGPMHLIALKNTPQIHNVVVCTLCSCYPRNLLGLPPDWYKSSAYRSRTVKEPRKVLKEFGLEIPSDKSVRVHDSTADMRYVVIPERPAGTEGFTEDKLASIVTRDSMIGVGLPRLT